MSLIKHKFIFSDYKKWYLEDGAPVVPPKTDQDVDLFSDPDLDSVVSPKTDQDVDLFSDPDLDSQVQSLTDDGELELQSKEDDGSQGRDQ